MILVKHSMPVLLYDNHNMKQGFITLISVLIVGAVGIAVAVSLILLGLSSSRTSFAIEQSNQAKALANACAEEALQQIRDSTPFVARSGSFLLEQGECIYSVTNEGGQNRNITVLATVGTIVRKLGVIINQINPTIEIVSWQELADL